MTLVGYKINTQKSVAFLHNKNKLSESEAKKAILCTISFKKIPRNKFNLEAKRLYSESYKTLRKETEEDATEWKHILCSWIGKIYIIKMSILPKQSIGSMPFLLKC